MAILIVGAVLADAARAQQARPADRPGARATSTPAPAAASDPSPAVPTRVLVHVVAHDAKLLQDPVGGARVTIRHAETGEVLAQGTQTGGSGSTKQIMQRPDRRGETIYNTPGAARYATTLPLSKPTPVTITARGPLDHPQAMQTASKSVLLVPGQDVSGDGVVLHLHGFIVEVLEPSDTTIVPGTKAGVRARVRMLCGCPTEPGGMWDARDYTIEAQLVRDGAVVSTSALEYAGTTSEYTGLLPIPDDLEAGTASAAGPGTADSSPANSSPANSGAPDSSSARRSASESGSRSEDGLKLRVVVSDPAKGNFGLATRALTLRAPAPEPQEGR
jgi:hypothetical protein